MVKQKIKYIDPFSEQEVEQELYFHFSKADLIQLEVDHNRETYTDPETKEELTGMRAHFKKISTMTDMQDIKNELDAILQRSYGERVDGRFVKSPQIWQTFYGSEAYSEFLFYLLSNPHEMATFMKNVMPAGLEGMSEEIDKAVAEMEKEFKPVTPDDVVTITPEEASAMPAQELQEKLVSGKYKLS